MIQSELADSENALQKPGDFLARGGWLYITQEGAYGLRLDCDRRRQRWFGQITREIRAHQLADLFESIPAPCIDEVYVAQALLRQISHLRQSAFHPSIVALVSKSISDGDVVTEAIAAAHAGSCRERA